MSKTELTPEDQAAEDVFCRHVISNAYSMASQLEAWRQRLGPVHFLNALHAALGVVLDEADIADLADGVDTMADFSAAVLADRGEYEAAVRDAKFRTEFESGARVRYLPTPKITMRTLRKRRGK